MFNILKGKSPIIKITQIILFITTALYLLESIFLAGLFTNIILACTNIIVSIITLVIAIIKKESKLALIDLAILLGTSGIFAYVINL